MVSMQLLRTKLRVLDASFGDGTGENYGAFQPYKLSLSLSLSLIQQPAEHKRSLVLANALALIFLDYVTSQSDSYMHMLA